jgi:hypothetical protein
LVKEKDIAAEKRWAAKRAGQALPRDHPQTLRMERSQVVEINHLP